MGEPGPPGPTHNAGSAPIWNAPVLFSVYSTVQKGYAVIPDVLLCELHVSVH